MPEEIPRTPYIKGKRVVSLQPVKRRWSAAFPFFRLFLSVGSKIADYLNYL